MTSSITGTSVTTQEVILNGSFSTTITTQANENWSLNLPTNSGSSNQFLQTDGMGNTTWVSGTGGNSPGGSSGDIQINVSNSFGESDGILTGSEYSLADVSGVLVLTLDSGSTNTRIDLGGANVELKGLNSSENTSGTASNITITAGTGAGAVAGGNITLTPGTSGSGTDGECTCNSNFTAISIVTGPLIYDQVIYQDQKSPLTNGGTFTSGAWRTRVLNTELYSRQTTAWSSLSSNQITLQAGTYYVTASAPSYRVNQNRIKIRNITDLTDEILGTNEFSNNTQSRSFLEGVITVASAKTYELQHRGAVTIANNGFGISSPFGINEVFATIRIIKLL